ncbi:MAG: trigger factor [Pseudomonadota bacterium]
MDVTETLNEGLKREYKIVLTAAELDDKVTEKLKAAQPDVQMKGFRKGKVPMAMLRKQFGKSVLGEAMQETIDGAITSKMEETGDKPAMQPEVKMVNEDWQEGDDVEVTLAYEKLPEIAEVALDGVKVEKLVVKAAEADVTEALENLAKQVQDFEAKKGKAKDGDQIVFNFVGKVDGEPFEGGSAEDFPLVLGSGSFIPGFEDQLVGVKAGDEKNVEVTFPEDYQAEHLAGKAAVFECKINEVKSPVAAEINDELATKMGSESLDDLKTQISDRLEAEYAEATRMVMKRNLMDEMDKKIDFEVPASLLDAEAQQIAYQLHQDDNPEATPEELKDIEPTKEHISLATRRVKLGLYLAEIGTQQSIEVTEAEMQQAVMQEAQKYPGQERAYFEFIQKNPGAQQQLRAPIFEEKVIDHILEGVTVKEKEVSKDELQKAVDSLEV